MTGLTKVTSWHFDILNLKVFFKKIEIFVNMGPYGSGHFKTLLPQLLFFLDETFSEYSL